MNEITLTENLIRYEVFLSETLIRLKNFFLHKKF